MATKTLTLELTCPKCGDRESSMTLDLNDMGAIECGACGSSFTPDEAVEKFAAMAEKWAAVATWIKTAPTA